MRIASPLVLLSVLDSYSGFATVCMAATSGDKSHLLQRPALSQTQIVFNYAGDLWSVDRKGGHATRLTVGVGIETSPVFSPDGSTIAFTGEYDGNTDVFTIPAAGGVPHRVTYHPAVDAAVGWSPDGKQIVFRSDRQANSRYTQLYEVPAAGGFAKALPLPMAYEGRDLQRWQRALRIRRWGLRSALTTTGMWHGETIAADARARSGLQD